MLKKMSLQLYKKMQKEMAQTLRLSHFILAGVEGLEPSRTVLETGMLPLHHTPKERHIKFLFCSICNIGLRFWRPMLYQLSYTPKSTLINIIPDYWHIVKTFFKNSCYFLFTRRAYWGPILFYAFGFGIVRL